ncbi:hypothetical protein K1W54_40170 [Micromonospora sp. CPCC 205371]|nr:hypothetical protein [Micromonospora sp. CPCC 205371]
MTNDDGVWRDEEKLPVEELTRAMGVSSQDGQVDDVTGNDAGAEAAFGHDEDIPDHEDRPTTTGRTGPH